MTPGQFPEPVQPLSVGNVISAGIKLYFDHFKQYLGVALKATLWILLPFILIIPAILFFATYSNYLALLGLLIPAWIVLLLYCSARYASGAATIARLAFGELTHQSETVQQASRFTQSRMWGFFLVGFLVSLIFGGVTIAFYISLIIISVVAILIVGGAAALQNGDPEAFGQALANNPAPLIGLILLMIVMLGIFVVVLTWLSARFAIAEVPLAIETETSSTDSIGRSWSLTKKNAWRTFLIVFVTFLITIPWQLIVQVLNSLIDGVIIRFTPPGSPTYSFLSLAVSYILGFGSGMVLLPLWQSIKAVIYYDLRSRREGLGLELRDRPLDSF